MAVFQDVFLSDLEDYTHNNKYDVVSVIKDYSYVDGSDQTQHVYKAIIKDVSYKAKLDDLIDDHQVQTIKISNNPHDFMIMHGMTIKELYEKLKEFFDSDESKNWYIDHSGYDYNYNKNSQRIHFVYLWKMNLTLEDF